MRICIPTEDGSGLSAKVFGHFGSTPYFTIYDEKQHSLEIVTNSNSHHSHGACHPLSNIESKKIDVVICRGMGARALNKLNEVGIRAFISPELTVEEILVHFKAEFLPEMTTDTSCQEHSCD